jgi:predicted DNA-binding transcriptional regulator AlpA
MTVLLYGEFVMVEVSQVQSVRHTQTRVLSYPQAADRANLSRRQLEREISVGRGPSIVDLSPRRRGILESDLEAWLLSRRRPAPSHGTLGAQIAAIS